MQGAHPGKVDRGSEVNPATICTVLVAEVLGERIRLSRSGLWHGACRSGENGGAWMRGGGVSDKYR
jgi:hypothetical protein